MKYLLSILACLLVNVQVFNSKSINKLGSEYVEIGGETYFFDMQNHMDWETAEWICQEYHNMTLISLQTEEKNTLIKNFLLEYPDFDMNLWSSGARLADGNLLWRSTGEEIVFQDWAFGEPNLPTDTEMCIIFSADQPSGWDDIECTDRWFAFVCENPPAK